MVLKRSTIETVDQWVKRRFGKKYFEESEGGRNRKKKIKEDLSWQSDPFYGQYQGGD
jgi:hypothetical protein